MIEPLSQRRLEVLRFLALRASRGASPPSVREVQDTVGLRSTKSTYGHLKRLEEAGYVEREFSGPGDKADGEGLGGCPGRWDAFARQDSCREGVRGCSHG